MVAERKPHQVSFEVDGELYHTDQKTLTPDQIMALAHIDPYSHYLIEIRGRHRESYEGRASEPIRMKDGMRFISVSSGPTPVS